MTDAPTESEDERGPNIRTALVVTALGAFLAIAPWPAEPIPHLVQKLGFLAEGTLTKPIDIFDLAMHGGPLLVALVLWARIAMARLGSQ